MLTDFYLQEVRYQFRILTQKSSVSRIEVIGSDIFQFCQVIACHSREGGNLKLVWL